MQLYFFKILLNIQFTKIVFFKKALPLSVDIEYLQKQFHWHGEDRKEEWSGGFETEVCRPKKLGDWI